VKTLEGLVQEIPEREPGNLFRLPVDRVFTIKGFGTVITGTTVSGHIRTGDEVTVYPREIQSRIRGIQVHGKDVDEVRAGLRTAVNLQGVDKAIIRRGDIVATKDSLRPTYMVDVLLDLLPSAPRKLKNRAKVRFHSGTSEIISTVVLLDRDELIPGESCFAQIRLEEPIAVLKQDRYVVRSYSPVRTIGGGEVLNPLPKKKKRFSEPALSEMKILHTGDFIHVIEQFLSSGGFRGISQDDLAFLANVGKKMLDSILKGLMAKKTAVQFDKERGLLIHRVFFDKARAELVETIRQYHKDFPLKPGLLKEELRSKIKGANNPKLFNFLVNMLWQDGTIVLEK
jgi:selenocysteine-specific elongation factor